MKSKAILIAAAATAIAGASISSVFAKTITLTLWDWHQPRMDILKPKLVEYQKLHPNIKFKTTIMADFWDKLLASMVAGTPPDIIEFHNSWAGKFVPKLLAPFPMDMFPMNKMRNEYYAFDRAFTFSNKFYFFPDGLMTGSMYYNKQLWAQAGIGTVPATWAELRLIAKKLTKTAANGKLTQAGLNFTPSLDYLQYLWDDLNYQQGGWLYNKEKTGVSWNNPQGLKALNYLADLALQDHVTPIPGDTVGQLETGKSAIQYNWTWYQGILRKAKKINYGAFAIPTENGQNEPARGRNNYECGYAVPSGAKNQNKIEAFKFLKWLYSDDKWFIQLNDVLGRVPGRTDLWNSPEIKNDPVISVVAKQIPYTVFPGERASWIDTVLGTMATDVLSKKLSPAAALKKAHDQGNIEFRKRPPKWIVERQYRPGK